MSFSVLRFFARKSAFLWNAERNFQKRGFKAVVLQEFGKPLITEDVKSVKKLKPSQVRIRVHRCGVNNSDVLTCNGEIYDVQPKLPFVPGFEISGEVMEMSEGCPQTDIHVGDNVLALSKGTHGGFAEECVVPFQDVWKLPSSVSHSTAAALADSYATAYLGLVRRAAIQKDDVVLVTAAAGGLGLAAVDLAANVYKAKVIGVCGTEDKATLVRAKGAWSALTYRKKDLIKSVKDVSNGEGVRVVFDAVGGEVFQTCLECVAHEGCLISAGFASRQIPHIDINQLLPRSCSLVGLSLLHYRANNPAAYRDAVAEVIEMASEGLVDPHISATFKLEQVNEAFAFMAERKSTGKIILEVV